MRTTVPVVFARSRIWTDDPVRVARELVTDGCTVAFEHVPAEDAGAGSGDLVDRLSAAGLASHCELTVDVGRLCAAAENLVTVAGSAGLAVALAGPAGPVTDLAQRFPEVRVVVRAAEPDAEARCRAFAGRRVRLVAGRPASDLAFVRCLNVLMAGDGHPAIAASSPRLIAIAGERAAWNGRPPESWEHVLPYGILTEERRRLVAAGYAVRVAVPSGPGAGASAGLGVLVRRLGGRS
jgi:proline dehydrogenase